MPPGIRDSFCCWRASCSPPGVSVVGLRAPTAECAPCWSLPVSRRTSWPSGSFGKPTGTGPEKRPAARRVGARTIVIVTLGAILLTALFNGDELVKRAEQMPFGWQRTYALRLADANRDVARSLWLDRPRRALDQLFGHGSQLTLPPPPTTTTTTMTTTTPTTTPTST